MGYAKFKEGEDCAYPKRIICNYCDCGSVKRCEYMKFISLGNWHCIYKKELKDKQIEQSSKGA